MKGFQLDAIRDFPDEGPVAMLNLIKFREASLDGHGSGRDAYQRYSDVAGKMVEERGGQVVWVGKIQHAALHEGGDVEWDRALLVTYPNRAAFLDMVTHPVYQKANIDRQNGVEKHVIIASKTVFEL